MALRFLGKDPASERGGSPTVWEDGDDYVLKGWKISDVKVLNQAGPVPDDEALIRFPKRMMQFFPEVKD